MGNRLGSKQSYKLDELCASQGLDFTKTRFKWKTKPRNDHRPRLNTTESINAIFERCKLKQVIEIKRTGSLNAAGDLDCPRARYEAFRSRRHSLLARRELIEVVVVRDVVEVVGVLAFSGHDTVRRYSVAVRGCGPLCAGRVELPVEQASGKRRPGEYSAANKVSCG